MQRRRRTCQNQLICWRQTWRLIILVVRQKQEARDWKVPLSTCTSRNLYFRGSQVRKNLCMFGSIYVVLLLSFLVRCQYMNGAVLVAIAATIGKLLQGSVSYIKKEFKLETQPTLEGFIVMSLISATVITACSCVVDSNIWKTWRKKGWQYSLNDYV